MAGISQSCLLTATGHMNIMSFGALSPGWWKGGVWKGNEASVLSSGPKDLAQSFDGKVKRRVSTSSEVNQWPDIFRQRGQEKPHQSSYHVEGIQGTIPNFSLCANMSSFRNSSLMHFQL